MSGAFRKYSTENGQLGLSGFSDILSYLSDMPAVAEKEVEVGSGRKNISSKKDDTVKTKENSYRDNNNDDDMETDEEISVEKVFKELAGKRKIVTIESIIGWDIVAELLEDGTLNIEVI